MSTTTIKPDSQTEACQCGPECCSTSEASEIVYRPAADITETDQAFTVRLDMPGASSDGIDVRFSGNELSISAKVPQRSPKQLKQGESPTPLHREYGVGNFSRTFRVGEGIDGGSIAAQYEHGVLTLTLPKADRVRSRKIDVRVN